MIRQTAGGHQARDRAPRRRLAAVELLHCFLVLRMGNYLGSAHRSVSARPSEESGPR